MSGPDVENYSEQPDLKAPVKELEGTYPVVLYFGNERDRETFIQVCAEAMPGAVCKKL